MTSLSAIVPATDRPSTLGRCTAAIAAASAGPDELLVVDRPADLGPAAARNAGARRARGDVLVFVDSDVAVHPDVFARIRAAFEADPGLTGVFGNYDARQDGAGTVSAFRNLLFHHVHLTSAGPAVTFWSGLGAVRRDRFLAAGGFDAERYPHAAIEDIELGVRLSGAGARIVCDPAVMGTHLKAWSLAGMVATDVRRRGIPWVQLMLRTRRIPGELNLGWRHRLSAAVSVGIAWSLLRRRPRDCLALAVVLVGLNRSFYALLLRERGRAEAAAGVALHVLHHLASAAAVPLGVAAHAADARRRS